MGLFYGMDPSGVTPNTFIYITGEISIWG